MNNVTILLMPTANAFKAVLAGGPVLKGCSLNGFGTDVEGLLRGRFGDELESVWVLLKSLKHEFVACVRCGGAETLELDGIAGGYSQFDLTKRRRGTCPTCKGLGVDIENFWSHTR